MKKTASIIILTLLVSSVFCQIRTNLGVSAVFPISDSKDCFNTGISSDLSVVYNITQYVNVNGTFEYVSINTKNTDYYVNILSLIIGVGLDYNISPVFQIRITPNIGLSDATYNSYSKSTTRFGIDLSIGWKTTKHMEIEPMIGYCSIIDKELFSNKILDGIKTGIRIGYIF